MLVARHFTQEAGRLVRGLPVWLGTWQFLQEPDSFDRNRQFCKELDRYLGSLRAFSGA